MARQFVVVALVFFAIVGFACAAPLAEAPKASATVNNSDVGAVLAPGADNEIGNTDGAAAPGANDTATVVEGSVGGAGGSVPAEAPKSSASAGEFSTVAVVVAVAGFFFF